MKTSPPTERVQLRIKDKGDLHGYLFQSNEHAVKWLSQGFVQRSPSRYSVAIVIVQQTRYGEDRVINVIRKMSVKDYLASVDKSSSSSETKIHQDS